MNAMQRGFTLVELLVTLAISSALIAGLGGLLMQSKQTYKVQQTLSHMMEDGRYVLEVLSKESRRIGFLRNRYSAGGEATDVFVADNAVLGSEVNLGSGTFVGGAYSADGFDGNTYDVNHVAFRYQLNDATELRPSSPNYANSPCTRVLSLTDTDGNGTVDAGEDPATTIHTVTVYLYVGFDNDTNTRVLYCKAKRTRVTPPIPPAVTPTVTTVKSSNAEPLLSNVERLLVLYGEDTDSPSDGAANVYVRADGITNWANVVSSRLYVVLYSDETNIAQGTPSYRIDGQSVTPDNSSDKRLYRVFSTTISSRNH